jgi:hypothetical protein
LFSPENLRQAGAYKTNMNVLGNYSGRAAGTGAERGAPVGICIVVIVMAPGIFNPISHGYYMLIKAGGCDEAEDVNTEQG